MEFYKKSDNCLSTTTIHNNDIRLKDKTLYLQIEDDGGNISHKILPQLLLKLRECLKLQHSAVNSTAYV